MNAVSYPLADIRKITCEEMVGTPESNTADILVYPNPVHDMLYFRNISGTHTVSIYALDGRMVKTSQITGNQGIDISGLRNGLYLVNVNHTTFNMIKL